jgi:cytosine/adenosine deaminase-related metal-dependent hydrolase
VVRPLRLRARWVIPVASPVIPDAAILIGADGRILAVGPDAAVPTPPDAETLDLGRGILLPGLVNVHTHLELTGFDDLAPGREFRDWILTIRDRKQRRSRDEFLAAARAGVRDCWAAGVTTVADTGDSGAVLRALAELDASGIVYQEVFGPHPSQLEESFAGLEEQVRALRPLARGRLRLGVSPHAPYTVSGPLYARVAEWARSERLPVAVHIAESPAEAEFVTHGTGPFAEAWKARGIPSLDDSSHQPSARPPVRSSSPSPVEWLDRHGVLGPDTLCIHAIQISAADITTLEARGAAVAHCPLSNGRHGHGAAPLKALLDAGIRVGLGTDSVASIGTLDLLAETRAARELAGLDAPAALRLATLEGARALGLGSEIGSLTPGKWGDVTAISPRNHHPGPEFDPTEAVLGSTPGDTIVTVLGGRLVYRREPET